MRPIRSPTLSPSTLDRAFVSECARFDHNKAVSIPTLYAIDYADDSGPCFGSVRGLSYRTEFCMNVSKRKANFLVAKL